MILSLDAAAYTRELYGPGGPKYDPAFLETGEGEGGGDEGLATAAMSQGEEEEESED